VEVVHFPELSRYELRDRDVVVGVADYRRDGDVVTMHHTEIVPSRRNHGLGAVLVAGALDDVRARGARVVPTCWYVDEFLDLNPAYADLRHG
jgi:predicted GNAT family acetyltransferase